MVNTIEIITFAKYIVFINEIDFIIMEHNYDLSKAQYDKNNSLLVKSDFVEFVIKPHNNGGGKMVVRCNY